jgi:hypothetical protein
MKFRTKLFIGIATTATAVAAGGGIAFAVWTVTGSGNGGGAASVASSLTITQVTPTGSAASLYPGGPAGPVEFEVANPNPFAVTITTLAWGAPVSGSPSSCASSNFTIDANAPTTASISIPANATPGTVYTVNGVVDLGHGAGPGCEGQGFTVPLSVTAAQQ